MQRLVVSQVKSICLVVCCELVDRCKGRRGVAYVHGAHGAHIAAVVHVAVAHVAVVHSCVMGVIHDVCCCCSKEDNVYLRCFERCYVVTGSAVWSKSNDNVLNI